MAVQEKFYTVDEFWDYANQPENQERFLELIDGVIYETTPASAKPSTVTARGTRFIANFVDEHDLGYVTSAEGEFRLSPKDLLCPAVGFVAKVAKTRRLACEPVIQYPYW